MNKTACSLIVVFCGENKKKINNKNKRNKINFIKKLQSVSQKQTFVVVITIKYRQKRTFTALNKNKK